MHDSRFATFVVAGLGWLARLSGLALFLLVATLVVGHGGPPNPFDQPARVAIELWLMLAMTVGLIAAWRWELPGAAMTLVSLASINVVELVANHRFAGGAFPLFAIPPLLFVAHALLQHRARMPIATQ